MFTITTVVPAGTTALRPATQGLHLPDAWLRVCGGARQRGLRQGDVPEQGPGAHPATIRPACLRHHPVPG